MRSIMILPLALAGVSAARNLRRLQSEAAPGSCSDYTECSLCTTQDNCVFNRFTQECADKGDVHGKWDTSVVEVWATMPEECVSFTHPVGPEDSRTDSPTEKPTGTPTDSPAGGLVRRRLKMPSGGSVVPDIENPFSEEPLGRRRSHICGTDDREKVPETAVDRYPFNSIVRLEVYDGDDLYSTGTGFFISSKVIFTAAHVIWNINGWNKFADKVKVCPGYNNGSTPYGCQWGAMLLKHEDYMGSSKTDYAAIILPDEYFYEQGTDWFEYSDLPSEDHSHFLYSLGYPGELSSSIGYQWMDQTRSWERYSDWKLRHKLSVEGGNSGSPVYYIRSFGSRRQVVAITTHADCSERSDEQSMFYSNSGPLIKGDVRDFWDDAIWMGENWDLQDPVINSVGQYSIFAGHASESASDCPNLGCENVSGLEECQSKCNRDSDCNVIVYCPGGVGASCEKRVTGAGRCCLRNCPDLLENDFDMMLTTRYQGWDNYVNMAAADTDNMNWSPN